MPSFSVTDRAPAGTSGTPTPASRSANFSSGGAHTRTSGRVPATAPRVPAAVRRPRATPSSTTTHALRDSHVRRFWPRPATLRHDPGLAASPPVRYMLGMERSGYAPFPLSSPFIVRARCRDCLAAQVSAAAPGFLVSQGSVGRAAGYRPAGLIVLVITLLIAVVTALTIASRAPSNSPSGPCIGGC